MLYHDSIEIMQFWQEYHVSTIVFVSTHRIKGYMMLICLIPFLKKLFLKVFKFSLLG